MVRSYFRASYDSSWSGRWSCAELSRSKAAYETCSSVGGCFCFCVLGEAFEFEVNTLQGRACVEKTGQR
jgi:hypothetical protein